jgi:hypothetical protein
MKNKQTQQRQPAPETGKQRKKPPEKVEDSDDIERAVYDGMQDLRVERPKKR